MNDKGQKKDKKKEKKKGTKRRKHLSKRDIFSVVLFPIRLLYIIKCCGGDGIVVGVALGRRGGGGGGGDDDDDEETRDGEEV